MGIDSALTIGVDVGATKVGAYHVVHDEVGDTLDAGRVSASIEFARVADFQPLPVYQQERQAAFGDLDRSAGEREQARIWIESTARCIAAVARAKQASIALVGVAAPGRKSPDGTGMIIVRNGPRIPDFCELLERALRRDGVELLAPIEPLYSDGVTGCLGERRSAEGALHDVDLGYYLGGGTGLAEAVLVGSRVLGLDAPAIGLPPAWRLHSDAGPVYEDLISMRAIRARQAPLADLAGHLAGFLRRRLEALEAACEAPLRPERIAIGQALAGWLADDTVGVGIAAEAARELGVSGERAVPFVLSRLRPAPAIGAAALARDAFLARS